MTGSILWILWFSASVGAACGPVAFELLVRQQRRRRRLEQAAAELVVLPAAPSPFDRAMARYADEYVAGKITLERLDKLGDALIKADTPMVAARRSLQERALAYSQGVAAAIERRGAELAAHERGPIEDAWHARVAADMAAVVPVLATADPNGAVLGGCGMLIAAKPAPPANPSNRSAW